MMTAFGDTQQPAPVGEALNREVAPLEPVAVAVVIENSNAAPLPLAIVTVWGRGLLPANGLLKLRAFTCGMAFVDTVRPMGTVTMLAAPAVWMVNTPL
jgi:hypothetical protein